MRGVFQQIVTCYFLMILVGVGIKPYLIKPKTINQGVFNESFHELA